MEKIDIYDFRLDIQKEIKSKIPNLDLITNLLQLKGLVVKRFGLCSEPYNKYFEICNTDKRGVSSFIEPLNTIYVTVNYNTSTRKKKIFFHSIEINFIKGFYYICCLAQSSFYKKSSGAEDTVYKAKENEISAILDEIFNYVENEI